MSSVAGGSKANGTGNANDTTHTNVDKAMLAKQKLIKRARAELPPEDFPKFVEAMKNTASCGVAGYHGARVHEKHCREVVQN